MDLSVLLEIPVTIVQNKKTLSIREICQNKCGLIDFWHTNCSRCPAALEKLNESSITKKYSLDETKDIVIIACALSQNASNFEDVEDLVSEWENILHIYVDEENKESFKNAFSYKSVPFCAVFNYEGKIVAMGDPKSIDYDKILLDLEKTRVPIIVNDENNSKVNTIEVQPLPTIEKSVIETDNKLAFDDDF